MLNVWVILFIIFSLIWTTNAIDHLVKSLKGNIHRKQTNIWNNHKKAISLKEKYRFESGNGIFIVASQNNVNTVTMPKEKCKETICGSGYKDCGVCHHTISCSCFENSIHYEMCIHCHIAILLNLCNNPHDTNAATSEHLVNENNQFNSVFKELENADFPDNEPMPNESDNENAKIDRAILI